MIHAYPEIYLSKAQATLGEAFDHAINACDIPGSDFVKMFVSNVFVSKSGHFSLLLVLHKAS